MASSRGESPRDSKTLKFIDESPVFALFLLGCFIAIGAYSGAVLAHLIEPGNSESSSSTVVAKTTPTAEPVINTEGAEEVEFEEYQRPSPDLPAVPPGKVRFCADTAFTTSSGVTPRASNSSGSRST